MTNGIFCASKLAFLKMFMRLTLMGPTVLMKLNYLKFRPPGPFEYSRDQKSTNELMTALAPNLQQQNKTKLG